MIDSEDIPEKAVECSTKEQAVRDLAKQLQNADSIAEDVPVLSNFFHEVRTSSHHSRDGRYVALFDCEDGEWTCRSVAFLQSGTHYRDTGADLELSFRPHPFMSVEEFAAHISESIYHKAQGIRMQSTSFKQRSQRQ